MGREILLEVKDLRISATNDDGVEIPIVKGVSFDIHKGEVVALIGESGSGKTTISLAALAYTKPGLEFVGGQAILNGEDLLTMAPLRQREIRGTNVAYLAQSAAATFNPAITIGEQVTESAVLHGVLTQEEATKRALELYHALELPDADRIGFRYPHQVSGGQLQRLMAAMALCGKPDLMVLDEPCAGLDPGARERFLGSVELLAATEHSPSIVMVTHHVDEIMPSFTHVLVMEDGRVTKRGATAEILNQTLVEQLYDTTLRELAERNGRRWPIW